MVAGDPERNKRRQMSPKPLQTHYELLQPTHSGTVDEMSKDKESHKQRMQQVSCCRPGFWNLLFNSLLELKLLGRNIVVAYADDLIIATRGDTIRAVENYAKVEMSKINECSRRNNIKFNDKKSKAMLVTRRKRRKDKTSNFNCNSNLSNKLNS